MRVLLLIVASFFSVHASAEVYKCVGADGKSNYQSSPCGEGHSNAKVNLKTGSAVDLDEDKRLAEQKAQEAKLEQQKLEQQRLAEQQAKFKQDTENESAKNQLLIKGNPEAFSAYAIPPYQLDKLSPLVKSYQARLPEIERLRGAAALKAMASGQCGRVEASELNEKSSKEMLVFLVDCSSGKRMYFNEQELAQ